MLGIGDGKVGGNLLRLGHGPSCKKILKKGLSNNARRMTGRLLGVFTV